jgi:hypothetical protein
MSQFLPAPSGVAILREHILGVQAELFMVGYRDLTSGRDVPFFPSADAFAHIWDQWRSLLPQYAPPHEYIPPKSGTETDTTRGEMFRALDGLTRRLEELFGPAPEPREYVSALPAESANSPPISTSPNPEKKPIVLSTEGPRFPSHVRLQPLSPFLERWRTKREDHDQFVEAVNRANATLPGGWRLPDALAADWLASWVDDLFLGVIPKHDRLAPSEVAAAVDDIAALVEAFRFVERQGWLARAQRIWFYELPGDPGFQNFPMVDEIKRYRPEWDPRRDLDDQPGDTALSTYYDQTQFFDSAAFLLGTPTGEQLAWLRRLTYRPDPLQPIWSDPPRHHTWTRRELQRTVPELAGCLGVEWPDLAESLPLPELIRRVHNWIVQSARPELTRRGWASATQRTANSLPQLGGTTEQDSAVPPHAVGEPEPPSEDESATSANSPYTLGQLISELEGIEQSRELRLLNHQEQLRRNPLSAVMNRAYESAMAWRTDETRMPGISRVELLCDRLPGEAGITVAKVRRLRADICERTRCQISHANNLTLNEAADTLEGVHRVSLAEQQAAQHDQLHHGLATLDMIQVGVEPRDFVQVTGVSCKVIPGTTPTACPDAKPILPPSLLRKAEEAIRRLYQLPAGTTIHWLGHDTGVRSRCRCPEYRDSPFTAPFDQHRWAAVGQPNSNPSNPSPSSGVSFTVGDVRDLLQYQANLAAYRARLKSVNPGEVLAATWFPSAQPVYSAEILASLIEPKAPRLTQAAAWTLATYRCLVVTVQAENRQSPTENDLMLLVGPVAERTQRTVDELMRLPEREFYKFVEEGNRRVPEVPTPRATDSPVEEPGKPGRPPDPRKQDVVKYVRELRDKDTLWKVIPDMVFQKFKVRYTAETLRGYLKSG